MREAKKLPFTKDYLLWLFHYDRKKGLLFWKNHETHATFIKIQGREVGHLDTTHGYIVVSIRRNVFKVHRLILFLETGEWPEQVDHIDGNRSNNHYSNLRSSNLRMNMQNRKIHRDGRLVGAIYHKQNKKWISQISLNNKRFYLGSFKTEIEAHERYIKELRNV